jgi:hypothetical protein
MKSRAWEIKRIGTLLHVGKGFSDICKIKCNPTHVHAHMSPVAIIYICVVYCFLILFTETHYYSPMLLVKWSTNQAIVNHVLSLRSHVTRHASTLKYFLFIPSILKGLRCLAICTFCRHSPMTTTQAHYRMRKREE